MTLAFLGNVPGERVDALLGIRPDVDAPKPVRLTRYGDWAGPAVLWAGPRSSQTDLARVVDMLWQHIGELGISRDHRTFRPHVTLARKARQRPVSPAPLCVDWAARELVLVESAAGQRPLYRVLGRYAFKDSLPRN
jgi:2'-5' RNA ligase